MTTDKNIANLSFNEKDGDGIAWKISFRRPGHMCLFGEALRAHGRLRRTANKIRKSDKAHSASWSSSIGLIIIQVIMVVEVLRPIRSIWDHKGVIGDLLDYSIVDEIADQDGSTPVDLGLFLGLGQLLLKLIKPSQLGADCVLLLQL